MESHKDTSEQSPKLPKTKPIHKKTTRISRQSYPTLQGDICHQLSVGALMYKNTQIYESKMVGLLLLDEKGQILFADKTANEHLEGYLNSFRKRTLWELVLTEIRGDLVDCLNKQMNSGLKVSFLVYSKNSKRKYDWCPSLDIPHNYDYFFRYMKALTARISCVSMDFNSHLTLNAFWNQYLLGPNPAVKKCYLLETALAQAEEIKEILQTCTLHFDPVISKFQKIAHAKRQRLGITQKIRNDTLIKKLDYISFRKWRNRNQRRLEKIRVNQDSDTDKQQESLKNQTNLKQIGSHQQQLEFIELQVSEGELEEQFKFFNTQTHEKSLMMDEQKSLKCQNLKTRRGRMPKADRRLRRGKKKNQNNHKNIIKPQKKLNIFSPFDQSQPLHQRKYLAHYAQSEEEVSEKILSSTKKCSPVYYTYNPYYLSEEEIARQQHCNIDEYFTF